MKLAEALLLRADRDRTIEQLKARIAANARYQEGEKPAEDARELVEMARRLLDELQALIRQINHTNAVTLLADGRTLTDALAERDVLRKRYALATSAAEAASGADGRNFAMLRTMRSELKYLTVLNVKALRQEASDTARRLRELDAQVQQVNWTADLIER
jgi:hypothetical protein